LSATQTVQAEALLVDLAKRVTPDEVIKAAGKVAEEVDPVNAGETEAARLTRQREAAWRDRNLSWGVREGSLTFHGSLPIVEGTAFTTLIQAYANQAKRNSLDAQDPEAESVQPWQARADALVSLVADMNQHRGAPTLGGDRPTVIVTLDYGQLLAQAGHAGVLPDGAALSAGDLRRLCCDANLIPAVLGAASEPLDVGRASRFVTPAIRKALILRDKHCAFPKCDTAAVDCDAHHIKEWWAGGATALDNLVLMCPSHHALVEPDKNHHRDQWAVTIGTDGHPVFKPPDRYPDRRPMRNTSAPPIPADPPGDETGKLSRTKLATAA